MGGKPRQKPEELWAEIRHYRSKSYKLQSELSQARHDAAAESYWTHVPRERWHEVIGSVHVGSDGMLYVTGARIVSDGMKVDVEVKDE